jgi:hypothetical protein
LALGIDHPDGIEERLTTPQVIDWWRYYEAEPWGAARDDLRAEVQRRRTYEGDECSLGWEFPHVTEEQILEINESPKEFNDRMRRIAAEIESRRKQDGGSRDAQPESAGECKRSPERTERGGPGGL